MEFKLTKTCKDCKNDDSFELTKVQAAFEIYNSREILDIPCSACGSKRCESWGHNHPEFDKELLDMWGNDPQLFFMPQDQELLLAEYEYLPMILQAIDEEKYLKSKIGVLIEAICILLYDNTVSSEEYSKQEKLERKKMAQKVRPELSKRKEKIIEAGDAVMDYIKRVVYPQIGIDMKPEA